MLHYTATTCIISYGQEIIYERGSTTKDNFTEDTDL